MSSAASRSWLVLPPAFAQGEPVNHKGDQGQAEPGRRITMVDRRRDRTCLTDVGYAAWFQPHRCRRRDQPDLREPIGNDDPADWATVPAEFGIRVLRPAHLDRHSRAF